MKTIIFYLMLLFFLLVNNKVWAQDEFYSNQNQKEQQTKYTIEDTINYKEYSTAQDYYDIENNNKQNKHGKEYILEKEKEEENYKRKEQAIFVTNLIFDVFVNAVIIVAGFLQ